VIRYCEKPPQVKLDDLPEVWRPSVSALILSYLPKVILFKAATLSQLPDTVDLSGLQSNEVMQGVFRLAGIWDQREDLLTGNTRKNQDALRDASEALTTRIRQNWTQGSDLEFYLEYVGNNIRLTVKDTTKSVTAVGDRSEGFTSYFAMRMLLVARTESTQPHGYVFMFDEPGLNLHPKGQVDLQNVFESISETNQIVYSTHSVFLINKNYPDRNLLVFKNRDGSNIDNKPFVGGWAKVKEHLGLYLSANFLFADKILLAEGATDEAYLPLILQGLIERDKFDGDLNAFAIHTSLNDSETVASASMYTREDRRVAVLVDGDDAGNKRKTRVENWSKQANRKCSVVTLGDFKTPPCSIEDFLEPGAFSEAVILACKEAIEAGVLDEKENWETTVRGQLATKEKKSLGRRVEGALKQTFGEALSDVWIARKYGDLLRAEPADQKAARDAYWSDVLLQRLARSHLINASRG
jgi:predicted ATP-dependent endonuclease of OLD family